MEEGTIGRMNLTPADVYQLVQQAVASTQVRTPSGDWFRLSDGDAAKLAKTAQQLAQAKLDGQTSR